MFVRKKHNPSGVVSVQVIDKSRGRYRVVKTIGSSSEPSTIESLYQEGRRWISGILGEQDIFEQSVRETEEKRVTEYLLSNIENILLNGTRLILDNVFKVTGL